MTRARLHDVIHPGAELTLKIEKAVAGGRMLARQDGQVVLVAGAIPGERVRARVERTTRQLAFATVIDVLDASPHRRVVDLDPACGGSVFACIAYDHQLALKSAILTDALTRIGRMQVNRSIPIEPSPERGYRMRARFHVQEHRLGFFREGTHELCDPASTGQLLPETVEALARLVAQFGDHRWRGIAAVELAENLTASDRAVHLEVRDDETMSRCNAVTAVEGVTGLTAARIDRQEPRLIFGTAVVADRLHPPDAGAATAASVATIVRHAQAFFQANRYLLVTLVERVAAHLPVGPVVDLYAGVGLFAVSLAAGGWPRIVAVEGDRVSAADLEANARPFGGALTPIATSVEAFLHARGVPSDAAVIVDPPRTGLSKEVVGGILAARPGRVVYVSCDVATLARDLRTFAEGGYRLDHLEALDVFPNTAHLEVLAVLGR